MPPYTEPEPLIPRTNDDLADLHYELAAAFQHCLGDLAASMAVLLGDAETKAAFASLLIPAGLPVETARDLRGRLERDGVKALLDEEAPGGLIDTVDMVSVCRQAAEYANQGCAPLERPDVQPSQQDRERRVRELIASVERLRPCSDALIGKEYDYIWQAFDARKAIDGFGGKAPVEGLRVLASLPLAVLRTAISNGDLPADQDRLVEADTALAWLSRRREFCPSRWRNLKDDQWPFDPARAVPGDDSDTLLVPQDGDGKPFVPSFVVRSAKSGGLSITIGAKGRERQFGDYYDALRELSALASKGDVPRWRRRNDNGNWGIVRARGPWVAVSKSDVASQLEIATPAAAI